MKKLIYIIAIIPQLFFAQVGIGTVTPEETLHVKGTTKIANTTTTTPTKLLGLNNEGTVNEILLGDHLVLDGNTLKVETNQSNSTTCGITSVTIPSGCGVQNLNNFNLNLNGVNSDKELFKLEGGYSNYRITGIAGGTNGRHITLVNVSFNNLRLMNENTNSQPQNRLMVLANNISTSGQGTADLVYDGELQRWILIDFRS